MAVWSSFALLNLLLATLMLRIQPRTAATLVLAVLFGFNGAVAVLEVLKASPLALRNDTLGLMVDYPTGAALLALPFVYPRRMLPRWAEGAGVLILAAIGVRAYMALQAEGIPWNSMDAAAAALAFGTVPLLGVAAGLFIFLDAYLGARTPLQAQMVVFLLAAYALKGGTYAPVYVSYLPFEGHEWPSIRLIIAALNGVPLLVGLAAVLIGIGSATVRRQSAANDYHNHALVTGLLLGGLALGTAQVAIQQGWLDHIFRVEHQVIRPLLLSIGVLRFQVLDVDLRRESHLVTGLVIAGILALFVTLQQAFVSLQVDSGLAAGISLVIAGAGAALVASPALTLASSRDSSRDRLVYRAALEAAILEPAYAPRAEALRKRLSIGEAEHALAAEEVRRAIQATPSKGGAPSHATGRYSVQRVLGEGGGGRAHLAFDQALSRHVVLKTAHADGPQAAAASAREARLLASVRHPNVVTIHDVTVSGGQSLIVMEYIEGGSLEGLLKGGPIPLARALDLFDQILSGLEAVHSAGLIHGDIKPANVLIDADGHPKLGDFGIARSQGSGTAVGVSLSGAAVGSIMTMAPEQVRGIDIDARADIYSSCAVLYEMLAGHPYLDLAGRSDFDTRVAILEEAPRLPLDHLPQQLNEILASGLAKDRSQRPATVSVLRKQLAHLKLTPGVATT